MRLKFSIFLFFFLVIFLISCSNNMDSNTELGKEHFELILYDGLTSNDAAEISESLESNYQRMIDDLRVQNMPKVTVKIWADYNNFMKTMETSLGTRYTGADGYIFGMKEARIYYTTHAHVTAVHEFAHLVSLQVNGSFSNNPRWLWEAVALYENKQFVDPNSLPYMVSGNYPTLNELNTDFNASNKYIYDVGYVLLEYIIQTWGMDSVIELIKSNGKISDKLGITTQEFESGWYKFVKEKYLT